MAFDANAILDRKEETTDTISVFDVRNILPKYQQARTGQPKPYEAPAITGKQTGVVSIQGREPAPIPSYKTPKSKGIGESIVRGVTGQTGRAVSESMRAKYRDVLDLIPDPDEIQTALDNKDSNQLAKWMTEGKMPTPEQIIAKMGETEGTKLVNRINQIGRGKLFTPQATKFARGVPKTLFKLGKFEVTEALYGPEQLGDPIELGANLLTLGIGGQVVKNLGKNIAKQGGKEAVAWYVKQYPSAGAILRSTLAGDVAVPNIGKAGQSVASYQRFLNNSLSKKAKTTMKQVIQNGVSIEDAWKAIGETDPNAVTGTALKDALLKEVQRQYIGNTPMLNDLTARINALPTKDFDNIASGWKATLRKDLGNVNIDEIIAETARQQAPEPTARPRQAGKVTPEQAGITPDIEDIATETAKRATMAEPIATPEASMAYNQFADTMKQQGYADDAIRNAYMEYANRAIRDNQPIHADAMQEMIDAGLDIPEGYVERNGIWRYEPQATKAITQPIPEPQAQITPEPSPQAELDLTAKPEMPTEAPALPPEPTRIMSVEDAVASSPSGKILDTPILHAQAQEGDVLKFGDGTIAQISGIDEDANWQLRQLKATDLPVEPTKAEMPTNIPEGQAVAPEGEMVEMPAQKQAWEMTRDEWDNLRKQPASSNKYEKNSKADIILFEQYEDLKPLDEIAGDIARDKWAKNNFEGNYLDESYHEAIVKQALSEGKPVPAEVLKEYPDIAKYGAAITPEGKTVSPAKVADVPHLENLDTVQYPVQRVKPNEVAVRAGDMQFKQMDDIATGTNKDELLSGEWDELKGGIMLLWEPSDPTQFGLTGNQKYVVVNGHHRLDLANRAKAKALNAQVLRQADGVSMEDAFYEGAHLNIAEGRGSIYDQVTVLRNERRIRGEDAKNLRTGTGSAKERRAYTISNDAEISLYNAFHDRTVTPEQAEIIARTAPKNEAEQTLGIDLVVKGKAGKGNEDLANIIQLSRLAKDQGLVSEGEQLGLLGFDESLLDAMKPLYETATEMQRENRATLNALKGALRGEKVTKNLTDAKGKPLVNLGDKVAIQRKINDLEIEADRLDKWATDPQIMAQIKARLAEKGKEPTQINLDFTPQAEEGGTIGDLLKGEGGQERIVSELIPADDLEPSDVYQQAVNYASTKENIDINEFRRELGLDVDETKELLDQLNKNGIAKPATKGTWRIIKDKIVDAVTKDEGGFIRIPKREPAPDLIVNPDPTVRAEIDRSLNNLGIGNRHEKMAGKTLGEKLEQLYEESVDQQFAFYKHQQNILKSGGRIPFGVRPFELSRRSLGISGIVQSKLEWGTTLLNEVGNLEKTGKGLKQIIKPVRRHFEDLSALMTNQTLLEDAQMGYMPKEENPLAVITNATNFLEGLKKAYGDKGYQELVDVADQVREWYWKANIEPLRQIGALSDVQYNAMAAKRKYWAPLNRYLDKDLPKQIGLPPRADVFQPKGKPILKREGSKRGLDIHNALNQIIENTYRINNFVERERVAKSIVGLRKFSKEYQDIIKPVTVENISKPPPNIIQIWENGVRKHYTVPEDIYRSMTWMNGAEASYVASILTAPSRVLRTTAIDTPDFFLRNLIPRDPLTAFVLSKYGIRIDDLGVGLANAFGKGDAYWEFLASGAGQSMQVSLDRMTSGKALQQLTGIRSLPEILHGLGAEASTQKKIAKSSYNIIKSPLGALQKGAEFSELPTRLGVMRRAKKKGATDIEAMFEARDIPDFSVRGGSGFINNINQAIPFWRASVRGMDKTVRAFRDRPAKTLLRGTVAIGVPTAGLFLLNKMYNREKFDNYSQELKDAYWFIPTGEGREDIRIQKPYDIGAVFSVPTEHFLEFLDKKDPNITRDLWDTFVSVGGQLAPGYMPQTIRPIVEIGADRNLFTKRNIVPKTVANEPPEEQFMPYTTEVAKHIGSFIKYSPMKIDHAINGYFAGLGRYGIQSLDAGIKEIEKMSGKDMPAKPKTSVADYPVVRAFVSRNPLESQASQSMSDLYKFLGEAELANKRLDIIYKEKGSKEADKFKKEYPIYQFEKGLKDVAEGIKTLRKKYRVVYDDPKIDSETKTKKLDWISKKMVEQAEIATEVVKNAIGKGSIFRFPTVGGEEKPKAETKEPIKPIGYSNQ